MRNPSLVGKGTSLLNLQLTGRVSVDIQAGLGRIKKLGLHLKNTKVVLSDGKFRLLSKILSISVLFDYIFLHPFQTPPSKPTNPTKSTRPLFFRIVDLAPSLDVDLDNFVVEFVAFMSKASTRTLSLQLQKIKGKGFNIEYIKASMASIFS